MAVTCTLRVLVEPLTHDHLVALLHSHGASGFAAHHFVEGGQLLAVEEGREVTDEQTLAIGKDARLTALHEATAERLRDWKMTGPGAFFDRVRVDSLSPSLQFHVLAPSLALFDTADNLPI